MSNSFVYCLTDHRDNKLYVGVHKGAEDDGYVCSSNLVMEEYNKRPQDFTRQTIANGLWEDMVRFEATILKAVDAAHDPHYYNKHNGDGNFRGGPHTEKTKQKLRKPKKNTEKMSHPVSEKTKEKLRKPKHDGHGQRVSEANVGVRFYNDGVSQRRCRECPPGFVLGMLPNRKPRWNALEVKKHKAEELKKRRARERAERGIPNV